MTCKNAGGNFKISLSAAESASHHAQLNLGAGTTATSYPHEFQTFNDAVKFANPKCNRDGKGKRQQTLLEFPVFPDGHQYPFNSKPRANPGNARVIFTSPSKDFCGVISHTEKDNKGRFAWCT